MDQNFWHSLLEAVAWLLTLIPVIISQDIIQPAGEMLVFVATYFTSIAVTLLAILLFWVGPFLSLRLIMVVLGLILAIEILPQMVLLVFGFIKRFVPAG